MPLTDYVKEQTLRVEAAKPSVLSVAELNRAIRGTLEGEFDLVWVQGEISNFKAHSSGHYYFCLKDSKAQIKAIMFRGYNSRLKFKPQDGLEVIVRGRVTVYEPRGDFQINVELMEPVGAGALQQAFEQLKQKLLSEGLFDSSRKRDLPAYPKHIAVVTSPTGAAIRDMLNVLGRRNRGVAVTLVPTIVQGPSAADKICEALREAWKLPGVDLIIVGRGGGSIEDLWAFNDENLARLIAASPVPVISAVGHEIDFTIADFVADLRAPTPSAAAELAVRNVSEIGEKLRQRLRLMMLAWNKLHHRRESQVHLLGRRLVDPKKRLQDLILRNDELSERLSGAMMNLLRRKADRLSIAKGRMVSPAETVRRLAQTLNYASQSLHGRMGLRFRRWEQSLNHAAGLLNTLSPLQTLGRGYSITMKDNGIIRRIEEVSVKDKIRTRVNDGWIESVITGQKTLKGDEQWILRSDSAD